MENISDSLPTSFLKEIEPVVEVVRKRFNIPGLSLAVLKTGKTNDGCTAEFQRAMGFGCLATAETSPVTASTKFNIGSCTKAFTSSVLAAVLTHNKRVTWDTPIKEVLGMNFSMSDQFRTEETCLRDLLAHKMGYELGESDMCWLFDTISRNSLVKNLQYLPATSSFRTKFFYNNLMYTLAAVVAEKLTGQTWEELVENLLFQPLGMQDSTFIDQAGPAWEDVATPHVYTGPGKKLTPVDRDVHRSVGFAGPCGSILSSARDMLKWMHFLLNHGKIGDIPLINKKLLAECLKPQFALPAGKPEWDGFASKPSFPVTETRDTYGFGWYLGTYRGYKMTAHSGELFGYDAQVTLYQDCGIGIYTAMNGPAGADAFLANQLLHYFISDILLGEQPWLDESTICSFPEPWGSSQLLRPETVYVPLDKTLPAMRLLKEYEGIYEHKLLGKIYIQPSNSEPNCLHLSIGRTGNFRLYPNGETDEFRMMGVDKISFLTEADMFAPTTWMTVCFVSSAFSDQTHISALHCSLFESGPLFVKCESTEQ